MSLGKLIDSLPEIPRKIRNRANRLMARFRSSEQVFTEIYRKNQWGGATGEICSGGGTSESKIADAYIDLLSSHSGQHGFDQMVFVDLGCGDMAIGKRLIPLCKTYVGVDVVKYIIDHHQRELGNGSVHFKHLDIVEEELPEGDVCFVRQVLQHLSNHQILRILPKLRKYRYVYITEHIPSRDFFLRPNLDKLHGKGIRLDVNSGVKLTAEPFGIPENEVRMVLEISGNAAGGAIDPGLIQTVLYTPGNAMR